jgi:hypothetical protein
LKKEVSVRIRILVLCALGATVLLLSSPAGARPSAPSPPNPVTITVGSQQVELWPYTANDFSGTPSDLISLVFPNTDPRQIRHSLMALDGSRPAFAGLPFAGCVWQDAMGNEQAAWAEAEGWVGGAVQLACVTPGAPLGNPFRVHARFFREGMLTLGAAHLDFLIPGTAEHETLSWDFPRTFVTYDMARTGSLTAPPEFVGLVPAGTFGVVRRPIYDALVNGGAGGLLAFFGLALPTTGDVPIPADGAASILAPNIPFQPKQAETQAELNVVYGIDVPKPFCAGPTDFVHLAGPLHLVMTTHTNPSGYYSRTYTVSGLLTVTPLPSGTSVEAVVFEGHSALLTDHKSEVTEIGSQTILSQPIQALLWKLSVGQRDRYSRVVTCGR